ncbi:hypothetical protein D3C72_1963320 [compost metagenome]
MPAPEPRDEAGQRTGEHDAEQQPAHYIAYYPSAVFFSSKEGSIRHKNLGSYRAEPDEQGSAQEQHRTSSECSRNQCRHNNDE